MSLNLRQTNSGCTLAVRVHPGARRNAITGIHDGALKISLTTPPTDGRANAALIAFLADHLHIPRAHITLVTGATTHSKTLHLEALTPDALTAALLTEPA
jgi:uncharacterized protein (TIGR00251 family)